MILTSVVLTFVTLAAASQVPPPAPAGSDAVRVHTVARPDGRLQIWEISRGRLAPLPRPAAGSIPLSGAEAITVARSSLSRQIPGIKEWTTVSITLRRFGTDGGAPAPNGWFYAVLLEPANRQPIPPPFASDQSRFWTVVLLDGTVVEPKIVDDPKATTQISAASPSQGDTTVYSVGTGNGVIPPRAIFTAQPRYTAEAMRARIRGDLTLRCVVDTTGMCQDVQVVKSLDTIYGLDEEAIRSIQQWRFTPGTLQGKPVKVEIVIELSFNLRDPK